MTVRWSILAAGVAGAVVGFLLQSNGPIGAAIWPMAEGTPDPEGANLALLMVMGAIEAVAFGAGIAFLVAGYPWAKAKAGGSAAWSWLAYLSIAWLLVNWVPHTALHMSVGNIDSPSDFGGLVAIEYGFHLTLIVAGIILALFTTRILAAPAATGATAKAAPATTRRAT